VTIKEMTDLARVMMDRAHAPYSHFHVGSVLRGANGKLYGGCNVENAAYPQGLCAEATAIGNMVADGETSIVEILVMANGKELVTPCGGCRQRLREFAGDSTPIHICDRDGLRRTVTLGELLPLSFGPDHLNISRA
jgi:cytidine deaminase